MRASFSSSGSMGPPRRYVRLRVHVPGLRAGACAPRDRRKGRLGAGQWHKALAARLSRSQQRMSTTSPSAPLTDGFHLMVDALKLNGVETIYGLVGIPITDLA